MTKIKQIFNKNIQWLKDNKVFIVYNLLVFGSTYLLTYIILNLMFINVITFFIFFIIIMSTFIINVLTPIYPLLFKLSKLICKENKETIIN